MRHGLRRRLLPRPWPPPLMTLFAVAVSATAATTASAAAANRCQRWPWLRHRCRCLRCCCHRCCRHRCCRHRPDAPPAPLPPPSSPPDPPPAPASRHDQRPPRARRVTAGARQSAPTSKICSGSSEYGEAQVGWAAGEAGEAAAAALAVAAARVAAVEGGCTLRLWKRPAIIAWTALPRAVSASLANIRM